MVTMKRKYLRDAIAMIELIFAIVVMGIVMMSAPMLISTATKSGYVAIQQEAINEAASQVNIILGYPWDESNTIESYDPVVLSTASTVSDLNENGTTGLRIGTPKESYRKFFSSTGQRGTASNIGSDTGDQDDIDDFDDTQIHLQQKESGGTADYIETTTIDIDRTVAYMLDDENGTGYADGGGGTLTFKPTFTSNIATTNIKRIQVTLTSSSTAEELDKSITLNAFSCNIGSFALEERP